jgi:hypothetical protein
MDKKTLKERQQALDSIPPAIRDCLSPEEIKIFLTAEQWPEELFQKLDEFIVKE